LRARPGSKVAAQMGSIEEAASQETAAE